MFRRFLESYQKELASTEQHEQKTLHGVWSGFLILRTVSSSSPTHSERRRTDPLEHDHFLTRQHWSQWPRTNLESSFVRRHRWCTSRELGREGHPLQPNDRSTLDRGWCSASSLIAASRCKRICFLNYEADSLRRRGSGRIRANVAETINGFGSNEIECNEFTFSVNSSIECAS
jgi:hypothetical protein